MAEFKSEQIVIEDENSLLTLRVLEHKIKYKKGKKGTRLGKFFDRYGIIYDGQEIAFPLGEDGNERFKKAVIAREVTKLIMVTDQAPDLDGEVGALKLALNFVGFKDEAMTDTKLFREARRKKIAVGDFSDSTIFVDLMQPSISSIETASVEAVTTD